MAKSPPVTTAARSSRTVKPPTRNAASCSTDDLAGGVRRVSSRVAELPRKRRASLRLLGLSPPSPLWGEGWGEVFLDSPSTPSAPEGTPSGLPSLLLVLWPDRPSPSRAKRTAGLFRSAPQTAVNGRSRRQARTASHPSPLRRPCYGLAPFREPNGSALISTPLTLRLP